MVKLADTQVLGACAQACGFESLYPHHKKKLNFTVIGKFSFFLIWFIWHYLSIAIKCIFWKFKICKFHKLFVNGISIVYNYVTDKLLHADMDKYHHIGTQITLRDENNKIEF